MNAIDRLPLVVKLALLFVVGIEALGVVLGAVGLL